MGSPEKTKNATMVGQIRTWLFGRWTIHFEGTITGGETFASEVLVVGPLFVYNEEVLIQHIEKLLRDRTGKTVEKIRLLDKTRK